MTRPQSQLLLLAILFAAVLGGLWWRLRAPGEVVTSAPADVRGDGAAATAGSQAAPAAAQSRSAQPTAANQGVAGDPHAPRFRLTGQVVTPVPTAFAPGEVWILPLRADQEPGQSLTGILGAAMARGKTGVRPDDPEQAEALDSPLLALLRQRDPAPPLRAPLQGDGSFTCDALPAPRALLHLHHPLLYLDTAPVVVAGRDGTARAGTLRARLGGEVAGLVQDPDGRPVAGAEVDAAQALDPFAFMGGTGGMDFAGMVRNALPRLGRSDAQGRFALWAIPPGTLQLLARHEPWSPGRARSRVVAGIRTELTVVLRPATTLAIAVVDPVGAPAAGIRVRVVPRDQDSAATPALRQGSDRDLTTDAAGQCQVRALPAGRYRVATRSAAWQDGSTEVELADGATASVRLELRAGLTLAGVVVDAHGTPRAGATVGVPPLANVKMPMLGMDLATMGGEDFVGASLAGAVHKTETDGEGRFVLRGLGPDPTEVVATAADLAPARLTDVTPPRADLRLQLGALGGITGRVVGPDQKPVAQFLAEALIKSFLVLERPVAARLDRQPDGRFTLAGIVPGSVTLRVTARGLAPTTQTVTVEPDALADVGTVVLRAAAAVRGLVVDPRGTPLPGVLVRRRKGGMADMAMMDLLTGGDRTLTDAEGQFVLGGLPAGPLVLEALHDDWAPTASDKVTLQAGAEAGPIRIVMDGGGTLTGELRLARGVAADGMTVIASCQRPARFATARVDAARTFRMEHLAPGSYDVVTVPGGASSMAPGEDAADMQKFLKQVMAASREQLKGRVQVTAGATAHVVLAAPDEDDDTPRVRWRGSVRCGGQPVAEAMVMAAPLGEAGPPALTVADTQGRFTLTDLTPGQYRVTVKRGWFGGGLEHHRELTLPTAAEFDQDLELPAGELAGRVVARGSDRGLRGVWVSLKDQAQPAAPARPGEPGASATLTDARGEFRFAGLADGSYQIDASLDLFGATEGGSARLTGLVVRGGDGRRDLRLEVRAGGSLEVTVLGPDGAVRPDCMVWLLDPDGHALPLALPQSTDRSGRACFGGLPAGSYQALARGAGLAPGAAPAVAVDDGADQATTVTLAAGTEVEVELRDAQGAILAGARITLRDPERREVLSLGVPGGALPEPGVYPLGALRPGAWTVQFEHARLGRREQVVTVRAGVRQRFVLRP